jgi:hypothetical protein
MNTTTDKLAEALRDFLEEADAGIVATPCTREAAREALAALEAEAKPADTEFIDGDCVIAWVTEPKRASPAAPAAPAPHPDTKDAERYRWLKHECDTRGSRGSRIVQSQWGLEWDEAIDAAIEASKKENTK